MRICGILLEESSFFWEDFLVVGSEVVEDDKVVDLAVDEDTFRLLITHYGETSILFYQENTSKYFTRNKWIKTFGQDPLKVVIMATLNDDHSE